MNTQRLSSQSGIRMPLTVVFFIFAAAYIGTISLLPYPGDFAVKAIPVLSLAVMAFLQVPGLKGKLLMTGFLFSAAGDITLSFRDPDGGRLYFTLGLGFFLVAHIFYVIIFSRDLQWKVGRSWILVAVLVFSVVMTILLAPKLPANMKVPVLVYVAVITAMGITATFYREGTWVLIIGAVLFMASDSVIAINTFLEPVSGASYLIMTTYYAGQFLIGAGLMRSGEG